MEKIRLVNSNPNESIIIFADICRISDNLIELSFETKQQYDNELFSLGFEVINEDSMNMSGNYYYPYNTVYKKAANKMAILLSNDGSVCEEPEDTESELLLAKNKENKINESKELLATYLESHPLSSDCHGGIKAKYTVTSEKQALMASNYLTYTIAKQSGVENPVLTWNAAGCECEVWTEEEYATLVLQISEYVKPLVSLQQSYEVVINACTTQEELDAIEINYNVYGVSVK